jgi:HSP20 family protein
MAWIRDEDFDKIFERIFKQMNLDEPNSRSWSYGYSMTTGPDGKPVIREWGTGLPNEDNPLKPKPFIPETPEPLTQIDIDQHNMQVRVIVEMPGFTKESIKITGREDKIQLSANDGTRQIDTEIPINARIDPKTAKATYNNGVLDITITLLEAPKSDNVDIKIN